MIIEQNLVERALQKRYGSLFPDKFLAGIYELHVQSSVIKVTYAAEEVLELSATTEFILRFISAGVNTLAELMQALGFSETLLRGCLTDELDSGRIIYVQDLTTFRLTPVGEDVLAKLKMVKPIRRESRVVFNKVARTIASQPIHKLRSDKELQKLENVRFLSTVTSNVPAKRDELKLKELDDALQAQSTHSKKRDFRVLEIQKSRTIKNGFLTCQLLVWVNARGQNAFLVEIDGQQNHELESTLRIAGGLQSLGIHPASIGEYEISDVKVTAGTAVGQDRIERDELYESLGRTQPIPDGGSVLPAEHRNIFNQALNNTRNRLLIISPWISRWIVNEEFVHKLDEILSNGAAITIAWGFDDATGKHKSRSHPDAVKRLIKLAERHKDQFNFVKMDQSHSKILVSDDLYVCTSHNWLSYDGSSPRAEWGEKRTIPSLVDDRYEEHLDFIFNNGHRATEQDIPASRVFNKK